MKYIVTISLFLIASISMAIGGTVKGVIKDAESKSPLIGANVVLIGTSQGSTTDQDGAFVILNVPNGEYKVEVSYLGYQAYEQLLKVGAEEATLDVELTPVSIIGEAINVVASRAKFRETPVAFTNVDKENITKQLGSRDIPMVLNDTPGIYATETGGGAGDARINVRGFDQRNTAVLINGVPVNDMENGWVYWSNWDGLGDVTSSIQVQRGLGASNLAISSVGGTLNIITDAAAAKAGVKYKQEFGSATFLKETITANTGLMNNGLAISATAVRKTGNGVVDQTWTDAWAYFGAISYTVSKNHRFDLFAIGAPQRHGQRLFTQRISTLDADYARKVFENDNLPEETIAALASAPDRGRNFNPNWGPIFDFDPADLQEFYNGSTHDFSDRSVYLDGEKVDGNARVIMERENYYHKPQINLNWYWNLSSNALLTNVLYYSRGKGGGTGPYGARTSSIRGGQFDGQIDYQAVYDHNKTNIDPTYSDTETRATSIIRNSVNQHFWYGWLSTAEIRLSKQVKATTGIDARYYKGEHWREVRNLLGGDYYIDNSDANQTSAVKRLGDKVNYDNDGLTRWLGGFLQLEGKKDNVTGFITGSVSTTGYKRVDRFLPRENGKTAETGWESFLGGTAKAGANVNLSSALNLYSNVGFISKAPIFDAVYNFDNSLFNPTFNEKIYALEVGSGYRTGRSTTNVNFYYTRWNNRSWPTQTTNQATNETFYFLLRGINARHAGVEIDWLFQPIKYLDLHAMASIGEWKWLNDVTTSFAPESDPSFVTDFNVFTKGLNVGDAAQKTFSVAATIYPVKGAYINGTYRTFGDYFANFDPTRRTNANDRTQPWRIPNYSLVDLHAGYTLPFDLNRVKLQLVGHVFNLLNTTYITDAVDGSDHTAASANVYLGLERRFNFGLNLEL